VVTRILKVGRNAPCPCGSGLKFKKCCLGKHTAIPVEEMTERPPKSVFLKAAKMFQERQRREREYKERYGEVQPQVAVPAFGKRMVAVKNRVYHGVWKFFTDFLRDYVPMVFGDEWCKAELAKPLAEWHPVTQWRTQGAVYMNAQPPQPDGSRVAPFSGALAAYTCFAYDLYIVDNNGELDDVLVQRLKNPEHFQGARHELFAEATCLRAGCKVQRENEKDGGSRHAEFTVRHVATGQLLSVEAKSKHRAGVLGRPGKAAEKPDLRFGELINDAVAKNCPHPLVIFLDTNLPFKWAERLYSRQYGPAASGVMQPIPSRAMQTILNRTKKEHDGVDPYSMIVLSNHPHHYAPDDLDPQKHLFSVLPEEPPANLDALWSIHKAAGLYGNIPAKFALDDADPPVPVIPRRPKVRYDFIVNGTDVTVTRDELPTEHKFSTKDKDRVQVSSPLHDFLESIGFSRVDARMVCEAVEKGQSIHGVMGTK
jgi:hypothetical protein